MEILKKEMMLKGYDAKKLSEKLGVSPSAVTGWINGDFNPRAKTVKNMKGLGFTDQACLEPSKQIEV